MITPNEVRQLMASGDVGSRAAATPVGGQADDVVILGTARILVCGCAGVVVHRPQSPDLVCR